MTERTELENRLAELDSRLSELRVTHNGSPEQIAEIERLQEEADALAAELFAHLEPWDHVMIARHERRPYALDYIEMLCEDFLELHGDRRYGDDGAIVAGLAHLAGQPVAIIGQQKGRTATERKMRNFGMPRPEGYRKALRIMKLAAKISRPIFTLIDTPGADCLADSESRGISEAIATNQREMFTLGVPIIATIIGEGGSGGAIALGVADRVLMLEHAYYSVIAPESCAAILWRDPEKRKEAAAALKLTAQDALALGVIDEIVPEPPGGAHRNPVAAAAALKEVWEKHLQELQKWPPQELLRLRYQKFRTMAGPEPIKRG